MSFKRPQENADLARYEVCLPDTAEWRTELWGAISLLLQDWQWEGNSSLSDQEIAQQYLAVINSFVRCDVLAGKVILYGGTTAPEGWLICDGSGHDTTDLSMLFDVLGYSFGGSGDTFKIPDMREKFPLGVGTGVALADTGGLAAVNLTGPQNGPHQHTIQATIVPTNPATPTPTLGFSGTPALQTGIDGLGEAHENMPPYVGLNYIISTGAAC